MRAVVLLCCLWSVSCCFTVPLVLGGELKRAAECPQSLDEPDWTPFTRYPVRPDVVTPLGVRVTSGGFSVSPVDVDTRLQEAEACLGMTLAPCALDVIVAGDEVKLANGTESIPCPPGWVCAEVVQPPHSVVVCENLFGLVHGLCHLGLRDPSHRDGRFGEGGCCR